MENGKQLLRIGPDSSETEAGSNSEPGETFLGVLVGKLRHDFLAARKMEILAADMYRLSYVTDEVHLDAAVAIVVDRHMAPEREIEIRAQLPVCTHKKVQIEFGGDPGTVIVSRLQHGAVLLEVNADNQPAAFSAKPANAPKKIPSNFRFQIPYG